MRILVTGGAGFIGSHLTDRLVDEGHEVRVIDNLSTGKSENLNRSRSQIEFFEEDIRDLDAVNRAMEGVEACFHEAALGSVPRSIRDPIASNNVNSSGTLNVLWAAKEAGVKRLIFASSSSLYGDTVELPKHEGLPTKPKSPYALSKLAAEEYCRIFFEVYGLETLALRYFNVFGPRQDPNGMYAAVIPRFIAAVMKGEPPRVEGDGLQTRDFTYIDNVVHANLLALNAPTAALGKPYNVATHNQFTMLELLDEVNRCLGKNAEPVYVDSRPGDVKHSFAAIDAARNAFGYEPLVTFKEGIARTVESFVKEEIPV